MNHYIDFSIASSESIEHALAQRLETIRLSRNLTQSQLASMAGVSRSTLARLKQGDNGISLNNFIRIMQALQLHGHLEALLPDPSVSPLEQLEKQSSNKATAKNVKPRQRARTKKAENSEWAWLEHDEQ